MNGAAFDSLIANLQNSKLAKVLPRLPNGTLEIASRLQLPPDRIAAIP